MTYYRVTASSESFWMELFATARSRDDAESIFRRECAAAEQEAIAECMSDEEEYVDHGYDFDADDIEEAKSGDYPLLIFSPNSTSLTELVKAPPPKMGECECIGSGGNG